MPRSKRVKVVSLTKTQPKGAEFKSKIIADVREGLDKYENVFVFRFENMRTVVFKDVRARFEESKICLGKNKLAIDERLQTLLGEARPTDSQNIQLKI